MDADPQTLTTSPNSLPKEQHKLVTVDDKQAIFMLELTKFGENEAEIR
jgi:hypothetical protein